MHSINRASTGPKYSQFIHVVFLLIISGVITAHAQSSLFNVPTTDVIGEGRGYVEADLDVNPARFRDGGWRSYGFVGIYGVNKRTEIGVNAYSLRTAEGFTPVELQPNIKYRVYNNETYGVAVSVGAIAYVPVSKRFRRETLGSVYAVASKQFDGDRSPRFTGGTYRLIGPNAADDSRTGFLLGVEQPLFDRVTFIADWSSGKNRLGYSAGGVGIGLTKRSYLSAAYYFGNQGPRNNFLGIYYGYSF